MASEEREFTSEEVARHNTEADLWLTIHGHAYDLTKFLKEHPGGEEVLIKLAGQDATTCFDEIGHSQEAIQLKDTLRVGKVVGRSTTTTTNVAPAATPTIDDDDWHYEESKNETSPYLPVFVALGVAVYAALFYYLFWS